jgi:hypothetical protein
MCARRPGYEVQERTEGKRYPEALCEPPRRARRRTLLLDVEPDGSHHDSRSLGSAGIAMHDVMRAADGDGDRPRGHVGIREMSEPVYLRSTYGSHFVMRHELSSVTMRWICPGTS